MTFILKNEPAFLAPAAGVNGLRMLGIVHEAVVFLLEQLYGSRHCRSYCFRFHKPEESDEPPINPHGSARAEISHRLGVGIVRWASPVRCSATSGGRCASSNCCLHRPFAVQEVRVRHVQLPGLQTPAASPVQAARGRRRRRAAQDSQVGVFFCSSNITLPSSAKQSWTVSEQKRLFSHFSISCCLCRRASMELPLAVRFKQLKATSRETVGVYRLELG